MMNWSTKRQSKTSLICYPCRPNLTYCTLYDHVQTMTLTVFKKNLLSLFLIFFFTLSSDIMWSSILLDIHYDLEYTCK